MIDPKRKKKAGKWLVLSGIILGCLTMGVQYSVGYLQLYDIIRDGSVTVEEQIIHKEKMDAIFLTMAGGTIAGLVIMLAGGFFGALVLLPKVEG